MHSLISKREMNWMRTSLSNPKNGFYDGIVIGSRARCPAKNHATGGKREHRLKARRVSISPSGWVFKGIAEPFS